MTLSGPARKLTVIVDEDAMAGHRPIYTEIVRRAHDLGLSGASVFRGIEGFGATGTVHTNRILSLTEKLPVLVVIVDTAERIEQFLPQLDDLDVRGLVTVEDVEVIGRRP